jgi:signal transduction histidine kinase
VVSMMLLFVPAGSSALPMLNAAAVLMACLAGGRPWARPGRGTSHSEAATISAVDRKERQQRAISAHRAKCEFLANMSHELRTPMNAVIGYSEMLLEDLGCSGVKNHELEKVHELGCLLLSRTNDILDLAKMELGRLPVFPEKIALEKLASDLLSNCVPAARRRGNELRVRLDEPAGIVELDVRKFGQIARHLFAVANDVVRNEQILITVTQSDSRVICTVSTSGGKGALSELGDIFYGRSSSNRFSETSQNARLGMALSRHLSALLCGSVSLVEEPNVASFVAGVPLAVDSSIVPNRADAHFCTAQH